MAKTFLSVKKDFMSFLSEFSNLYLYSKRGNEEVQKSFWKAYELAKKKYLLIYFPSLLLMLQGCGLDTLLFFNEKGKYLHAFSYHIKHLLPYLDRPK